jgi:fatty-acyl-CoA synthase
LEPEDFVLTFFAMLRLGVVPVPLYPPVSLGNLDAYFDRTTRVLTDAQAKILVVSSKLQNILYSLVDRIPTVRTLLRAEELHNVSGTPVLPKIDPDDLAFLQYTSGSTSDPKGVMVTHRCLAANSHAIVGDHLGVRPDKGDVGVSWLPLYHDMGLIGFVISTYFYGVPVVFIPTLRFLRRPSSWLETIHRHRGTIAFAPNFAYALATKKAKPAELAAWDLSCVRTLGCGAEPINPGCVNEFTDLFNKHCGLPETAILPAYGMAEATLAISLKPVTEKMVTRVVDAESFQSNGQVTPAVDGQPVIEHVSCGVPFPEHEVGVFSTEDVRLADGFEGELCVSGPSITPGYFNNPEATAKTFRNGWLHTGDLGYVLDGQVYVTGRIKDLIILNGRNIHPQSVEWAVASVEGVRKGNVVAFSRPGARSEELIVALETRTEETPDFLSKIRSAVQKELSVSLTEIVCLPVGALPKTSSGKLQRRKTRSQYLQGTIGKEGLRSPGSTDRVKLARHMAKGMWSRAKSAVLSR